jgi:hypothetical protein
MNERKPDMVQMNIGKWYDPISERWIVPRETDSTTTCAQSSAERAVEIKRRTEAQRIWELLVDCCAHE